MNSEPGLPCKLKTKEITMSVSPSCSNESKFSRSQRCHLKFSNTKTCEMDLLPSKIYLLSSRRDYKQVLAVRILITKYYQSLCREEQNPLTVT